MKEAACSTQELLRSGLQVPQGAFIVLRTEEAETKETILGIRLSQNSFLRQHHESPPLPFQSSPSASQPLQCFVCKR